MEHSLESHKRCVNELCRICGNICIPKKQRKHNNRTHKCSQMVGDILLVCEIGVWSETNDIFSKHVKCHATIHSIRKTYFKGKRKMFFSGHMVCIRGNNDRYVQTMQPSTEPLSWFFQTWGSITELI